MGMSGRVETPLVRAMRSYWAATCNGPRRDMTDVEWRGVIRQLNDLGAALVALPAASQAELALQVLLDASNTSEDLSDAFVDRLRVLSGGGLGRMIRSDIEPVEYPQDPAPAGEADLARLRTLYGGGRSEGGAAASAPPATDGSPQPWPPEPRAFATWRTIGTWDDVGAELLRLGRLLELARSVVSDLNAVNDELDQLTALISAALGTIGNVCDAVDRGDLGRKGA